MRPWSSSRRGPGSPCRSRWGGRSRAAAWRGAFRCRTTGVSTRRWGGSTCRWRGRRRGGGGDMDAVDRRNDTWAFSIIGFLTLVSVLTYLWSESYIYLSAYLWFGFIYGMCLQYGRFCFSSAFRDLFAVGVP